MGPVLFLSTEDNAKSCTTDRDDRRASWRAAFRSKTYTSCRSPDRTRILACRFSRVIRPTPLLDRIAQVALGLKPVEHHARHQADVFADARTIARRCARSSSCCAVSQSMPTRLYLLATLPSLQGIATDTGLSGSTTSDASARARMYLRPFEPTTAQVRTRICAELVVKKSNYGPAGEHVRMRCARWLVRADRHPVEPRPAGYRAQGRASVRRPVDRFANQNQTVGPSQRPTYTPAKSPSIPTASRSAAGSSPPPCNDSSTPGSGSR